MENLDMSCEHELTWTCHLTQTGSRLSSGDTSPREPSVGNMRAFPVQGGAGDVFHGEYGTTRLKQWEGRIRGKH